MKDWLIMVYLAGDNDLDSAARADLDEMTGVESSDRLAVIVQFDGRRNGTIRFQVRHNHLEPVGDPLPETNTGDPAVLTDFVRWARQTYEAHHSLLVLWNHGTGWEDVRADFDWDAIRSGVQGKDLDHAMFASTVRRANARLHQDRAIGLDATSRDFLDNEELKRGLANALDGTRLDILGFDACLMGMIEIGYQLRDHAQFMVASQEDEPRYGWPYQAILTALGQNPAMTPRQVSAMIVRSYGQMGAKERAPTKYTQSALDLARIDTSFVLVKALADRLKTTYPGDLMVARAIDDAAGLHKAAKRFRDGRSVDLYDWLKRVRRAYQGSDTDFLAAIDALLAHLRPRAAGGLVVDSVAEVGDDRAQVHGVSIYLPVKRKGEKQDSVFSNLYLDLDFAATGWGEFARKVSQHVK
jgi:Clostripain family